MISLNDFNKNRMRSRTTASWSNEPIKNGIACPECNAELMDSNPCVTLTSGTPQKDVKCSACDYMGYRLA